MHNLFRYNIIGLNLDIKVICIHVHVLVKSGTYGAMKRTDYFFPSFLSFYFIEFDIFLFVRCVFFALLSLFFLTWSGYVRMETRKMTSNFSLSWWLSTPQMYKISHISQLTLLICIAPIKEKSWFQVIFIFLQNEFPIKMFTSTRFLLFCTKQKTFSLYETETVCKVDVQILNYRTKMIFNGSNNLFKYLFSNVG